MQTYFKEAAALLNLRKPLGIVTVMYSVYILQCGDGTLYTGITTDVTRRVAEHREGKGGHYTRAKKIVRLLYQEKHLDRSSALRREAAIKRMNRKEKLLLCM